MEEGKLAPRSMSIRALSPFFINLERKDNVDII